MGTIAMVRAANSAPSRPRSAGWPAGGDALGEHRPLGRQERRQDELVELADDVEDADAEQAGLGHGQHHPEEHPACEQPSMNAASAIAVGSVLKNACMKNTVNGRE